MRLSTLVLAIATVATFVPSCAFEAPAEVAGDASVSDVPAPTDCDLLHREALDRCHILFQPGDCYEQAAAAYEACLGAATATPE